MSRSGDPFAPSPLKPSGPTSGLAALTLGAIGVVYGDIGTSPLYALKEVFANGHVPLTPENIYGVLSMVVSTRCFSRNWASSAR